MDCLFLLLFGLVAQSATAPMREHSCVHGSRRQDKLITGVKMGDGDRIRRQSRQPMRFSTHADSTITADLPAEKRQMIMDEVMPALLDFLSQTLSVTPLTAPILLDNQCSSGGFFLEDGDRECVNQCQTTMCGTVRVPNEHLKACVECNGGSTCTAGSPPVDGEGVANSDYILYISADQSECPGGSQTTVLAFAAACQMESSQDRPIAGYINFCPTALEGEDSSYIFSVAKHEMFHALGFSLDLFAYWRDQSGMPRTPRDQSGLPPLDSSNSPVADSSTVRTLTYTSWTTANGPVEHTVTALVTEAVLAEGRAHFGYPGMQGVELENQGGEGTRLQHWEKRLLGNEAMTGIFTFDPVFSRLSLAVMEDSGWYTVDYSSAGSLVWGFGRGRSFVEEGCGDLVTETEDDGNPFCSEPQSGNSLGCTLGRGAVAQCSRVTFTSNLDGDFQYFEGAPRDGGSLQVADFCPFYRDFVYQSGQGTNCSDPANQQTGSDNVRAERYGPDSRCVGQGRGWSITTGNSMFSSIQFGGGCYQYECTGEGVTIYVEGIPFECGCEGEEHIVDISSESGDDCVMGSIVCPSCSSICYDEPGVCPNSEPPSCYGRVVEAEGDCSRRVGTPRATGTGAAAITTSNYIYLLIVTLVYLTFG